MTKTQTKKLEKILSQLELLQQEVKGDHDNLLGQAKNLLLRLWDKQQ